MSILNDPRVTQDESFGDELPAYEVERGGEFYDVIPDDDGRYVLVPPRPPMALAEDDDVVRFIDSRLMQYAQWLVKLPRYNTAEEAVEAALA